MISNRPDAIRHGNMVYLTQRQEVINRMEVKVILAGFHRLELIISMVYENVLVVELLGKIKAFYVHMFRADVVLSLSNKFKMRV